MTSSDESMPEGAPTTEGPLDGALREWCIAACGEFDYDPPDEKWFARVEARLSAYVRREIEVGITEGTLRVEGFRFRFDALPSYKGPYAWFSRNNVARQPAPNWEYFVQAAEFLRLSRDLEGQGYRMNFEDDLMDISVWKGNDLVLCCEVKEKAVDIERLILRIAKRGSEGVDMSLPDRGVDDLRKAKYILRNKPQFLSVLAIAARQDFTVRYFADRRFELIASDLPFGGEE